MRLISLAAIAASIMIAMAAPAVAADQVRTITLPLLEVSCEIRTMDEARLIVASEWHDRLIGGFRPAVCYRRGDPTASDATLVLTGRSSDFQHVIKDVGARSMIDSSYDLVFIAAKCGQHSKDITASSTVAGMLSGCLRRPAPREYAHPFMRVLLRNAGVK